MVWVLNKKVTMRDQEREREVGQRSRKVVRLSFILSKELGISFCTGPYKLRSRPCFRIPFL